MGDASAEPSMEDILSSIKRIIAEEGESAQRSRRASIRPVPSIVPDPPADEPDEVLELSHPMPIAPEPSPAPAPVKAAPETIVSPETADATRGALDALSRLLVKPEPDSDGTLEGLVREMLRPMLREWLDANLPAIVETIVAREIAKITSTGR
ncbi:DUF2497 domain-containing protein [uncultured Sphingomonas sp.]|uniref:DUF2497 domain-containing protein n=1 Tax=uncultured Sphingomonas sp. TaxID=158754 RepID=UPI00262A6692|nr:DUF2497 domain-containing protein [uncultured Sphingomonas sp.]